MAVKRASPLPVAKYNDWTAHAGACRSVSLGARSGQLVASGGDDALVKLWHIRRPTELATLHGCKKAVVAVQFNPSEYHLLCGSETGMLSFFDLAHSKLTRQIAAHRTAVTALDWHPLNDALAACGGADTCVKLVDSRSGAEYAVMKGHARAVTCLRFTPDGRMIASGDAEGRLNIWDLTSGKAVHTFESGHSGGVTWMDFHPEEYLLAVSFSDAHVRVLTCDASTGVYASAGACVVDAPPRVCAFTPDGAALATLTPDALRLWDVPRTDAVARMHTLDVVDVPWAGVAAVWMGTNVRPVDAAPAERAPVHCVAAAMHARNVSVWGVDVNQLHPYAATPLSAAYARPHVRDDGHSHAVGGSSRHVADNHVGDRGRDVVDAKLDDAAVGSPAQANRPPAAAVASPPRVPAAASTVVPSTAPPAAAAGMVPSTAPSDDAERRRRKKHRSAARPPVAVRTIDLHADTASSEDDAPADAPVHHDAYPDDFHVDAAPSAVAASTQPLQHDSKIDDEPPRAGSRIDAIASAIAQARAVAAAVVQQAPAARAAAAPAGPAASIEPAPRRAPATSPLRSRSITPPRPSAPPPAPATPSTTAAPVETNRPRMRADSLEAPSPPAAPPAKAVHAAPAVRATEPASRPKQSAAHVSEAPKRPVMAPDVPNAPLIPSTRDKPLGLSFAAFMPANSARGFGMSRVGPFTHTASLSSSGGLAASVRPSSTRARDSSASERACKRMQGEHVRTVEALTARLAAVSQVASSWRNGDAKAALQHASEHASDSSVAVDIIKHVRVDALALEGAAHVINLSRACLPAVHTDAERVTAVFKTVTAIMATFKPVVTACVDAYVHACTAGSGAVDPAMEDRMHRCVAFVTSMHSLRELLEDGSMRHAEVRALALDVLQLIAAADAAVAQCCAHAASSAAVAAMARELGVPSSGPNAAQAPVQ